MTHNHDDGNGAPDAIKVSSPQKREREESEMSPVLQTALRRGKAIAELRVRSAQILVARPVSSFATFSELADALLPRGDAEKQVSEAVRLHWATVEDLRVGVLMPTDVIPEAIAELAWAMNLSRADLGRLIRGSLGEDLPPELFEAVDDIGTALEELERMS
jgi:hypothetical protein